MNTFLITFDDVGVISIIPVSSDADVLGTSQYVITTLEKAIIMLSAVGIDVTRLQNYHEPVTEGE